MSEYYTLSAVPTPVEPSTYGKLYKKWRKFHTHKILENAPLLYDFSYTQNKYFRGHVVDFSYTYVVDFFTTRKKK